jgi:hypothetical protein
MQVRVPTVPYPIGCIARRTLANPMVVRIIGHHILNETPKKIGDRNPALLRFAGFFI